MVTTESHLWTHSESNIIQFRERSSSTTNAKCTKMCIYKHKCVVLVYQLPPLSAHTMRVALTPNWPSTCLFCAGPRSYARRFVSRCARHRCETPSTRTAPLHVCVWEHTESSRHSTTFLCSFYPYWHLVPPPPTSQSDFISAPCICTTKHVHYIFQFQFLSKLYAIKTIRISSLFFCPV